MIIISHVQFWITWKDRPELIQYVRVIFENSTLPFLIISGFLFSKLSYRETTINFYRKKLTKVVYPYLFAFLPVFIFLIFFPEITLQAAKAVHMQLRPAWYTLFTGQNPVNIAMWFFPVIISFYLFFPFFKKVHANNIFLFILLFLSLLTSLLIHRPSSTATMLHSFLYFVFPYTLGITIGKFESGFFKFLKKTHLVFVTSLMLIYYWQTQYGPPGGLDRISDYSQISFFNLDASVIQKSLFSILLLFYFDGIKSENLIVKVADKISKYSFGLHLYHGYFLTAIILLFGPVFFGAGLLQFVAAFLVLLGLTWAYCYFLVRLFPKKGRFLIGR